MSVAEGPPGRPLPFGIIGTPSGRLTAYFVITYDYAQQTVALAKRERNAATSTIPDEYADEIVFWENAVVVATIAGDLHLRESGRLPFPRIQ